MEDTVFKPTLMRLKKRIVFANRTLLCLIWTKTAIRNNLKSKILCALRVLCGKILPHGEKSKSAPVQF